MISNILLILLLNTVLSIDNEGVFKVMTYNVRYADDVLRYGKDGKVTTRIRRVVKNIFHKNPDTIGFQEVTTEKKGYSSEWYNLLRLFLDKQYKGFGSGRSRHRKGEATPIFYNKNTLTLLESGTKWLSPTPDVPGSVFPSTHDHPTDGIPRVMTYGIFKRKADGVTYMHINTHLDHKHYQNRVSQIKVITKFIEKYQHKFPILLTADFNSGNSTHAREKGDAIPYLLNHGFVSASLCPSAVRHWTYPAIDYKSEIGRICKGRGYHKNHVSIDKQKYCDKYCDEERGIVIDYILRAPTNKMYFNKYEVMTDYNICGGVSSDHYPVYAEGKIFDPNNMLNFLQY